MSWFPRLPFTTPSHDPAHPSLPSPIDSSPPDSKTKPFKRPRPFSLIPIPQASYLSPTPNTRGNYSTIQLSQPGPRGHHAAIMSGGREGHQFRDENGNENGAIYELDDGTDRSGSREMMEDRGVLKNPFLDPDDDHEHHYEINPSIAQDNAVNPHAAAATTFPEPTRPGAPKQSSQDPWLHAPEVDNRGRGRGVAMDLESGNGGRMRQTPRNIGYIGNEPRKETRMVTYCCMQIPFKVFIALLLLKLAVVVILAIVIIRSRRSNNYNDNNF